METKLVRDLRRAGDRRRTELLSKKGGRQTSVFYHIVTIRSSSTHGATWALLGDFQAPRADCKASSIIDCLGYHSDILGQQQGKPSASRVRGKTGWRCKGLAGELQGWER